MRGWFRKVYLDFAEPLPVDGPIIFACTHPNSAIDYLFAPLMHGKPTYVLVRGDVFEKPALNAFFRFIFMLPVYRIRDGYSSLNKNEQSFKDCYRQFDKNGRVLIFSEGVCIQKKELQPIRKGTARLALDYVHKHGGKKMYIVPIATNYTRHRSFRSSVMVNYCPQIDVSKYDAKYAENANKAYEALTAEIQENLEQRFIQVEGYEDDHWSEKALMALRLGRSSDEREWISEDSNVFKEEKDLVDQLNSTGTDSLTDEWKAKAKELELNPTQEGLLKQKFGRAVYFFQMIILAPFVFLAWLTVALPYSLSRWIINTKIKDIIFDNTITIFGTVVFYLLQFLILLIVSTSIAGWVGLVIPIAFLTLTMLGIEVVDDYVFAVKNWKWMGRKAEFERLHQEVTSLVKP